MNSPRGFAIAPPDLRLPGLIFAVTLLALGSALALGWRELQGSPARWLVLATVIAVPALILVALFRRRVLLEGDTLRIIAGINQTRGAVGVDQAR